MSAAEALVVGGASIEAQVSASGQVYYTLSQLAADPEVKAVAFVTAGAFTLKVERYQQRETVRGRKYYAWVRELALTTTVKRNARGLASVNVFRTLKGSKLTNESLNTAVFSLLERVHPLLGEAYSVLLARTHWAVTKREPRVAKVPMPRPFMEHQQISKAPVYADFVRYAYPAYAEFAVRSKVTSADAPGFPQAFAPHLREPSWDRMVTKLFGTTMPQVVREALAPEQISMGQLAGAFMVRSVVPSSQLLIHTYAYRPYGRKSGTGWWLLAEARRALRAVDEPSRAALLRNFDTSSADFKKFEQALLGYAYMVSQGGKQLAALPKLPGVTSWAKLGAAVSSLYSRVTTESTAQQNLARVEFERAAQACFESVPHTAVLNDEHFIGVTAYGTIRYVWRVVGTGVSFDQKLFGSKNYLPHNSPLDRPRRLLRAKMPPHRKDALLDFAAATEVVTELHRTLDNLLRRRNLPQTPANRTRAYVALILFFRSTYATKAKITANWWDLLASDLPLVNVYEGFILNATAAEFRELLAVPVKTRLALSGYEPYDPAVVAASLL